MLNDFHDPHEAEAFRLTRILAEAIFDVFYGGEPEGVLPETRIKLHAAYRTLKKVVEHYNGQDQLLSLWNPLPGHPYRKKVQS